MKIIFQIPFKETLYAGRTIYNGYKNAFNDLGHKFRSLTADDNWEKVFYEFKPGVLIIPFNPHYQKFINFKIIKLI